MNQKKIKISYPIKLEAIKKKEKVEPEAQKFHRSQRLYQSKQKEHENSNQLTSMFAKFFKTIQKQQRPQAMLLQPRDRKITIDLPQIQDGKQLEKDQLQQWISEVSKTTFSTAFNSYFKDQMTFEQTKIYCSENILRNIVLLTDKINLSPEHMEMINSHLKNRVLPYMNSKYPMTAATDTNKAFQKVIKQVDNFDSLIYDFMFDTKVHFQYRQSGNYNDLIMRFLNEVMTKIDQKSKLSPELTNFKDFQNFMAQIFVKTEDQDWMNKKQEEVPNKSQNIHFDTMKFMAEEIQNAKNKSGEGKKDFIALSKQLQEKTYQMKEKQRLKEIAKQKYRTNVREYTHFLIGRKISQNTDTFSQNQIKTSILKIKSSAVLRTITKWCQQLQAKFTNEHYFTEMDERVKIFKTGKVVNLYHDMKRYLSQAIKVQKVEIDNFLKQIEQNNHYYQSALFTKQIKSKNLFNQVDKIQKTCAKTTINIVDSLHNYIIQYLNRLIHGLMKIAKTFFEQFCKNDQDWWADWNQSPINLLSFKIGDLMRCKCSSKEKEILKIFKEIQRLSDKQSNKIKIIRIKNRLKLGTNDILMNVRFNNQINCQIQLAIHSSKSKFINCSSAFNHYLYELYRSMMGPITQICCVWNNLDPRFRIYNKMVKEQPKNAKQTFKCMSNQEHDLKVFEKPFICNKCSIAYSRNKFIKDHLKCTKCKFFVCAKCSIQQEQAQKLTQTLFKDENYKTECKRIKFQQFQSQIPQHGACILIQAKKIKVQYFSYLQIKKKKKLFGIQNKRAYEIYQIQSHKQRVQFFKNYLVFTVAQPPPQVLSLTCNKANSQVILPKYLAQCSKKEKQKIMLLQQQLQTEQWQTAFKLNQKNKFNEIRTIDIRQNRLSTLKFINQKDFPLLEQLNLYGNQLEDDQLVMLSRFKNLKRLKMSQNAICNVKSEVAGLTNLQQLDLSSCRTMFIEEEFCQLKNLSNLKLSWNSISTLPDFAKLQNLKHLMLQNNHLTDITCLKGLKNIQTLTAGTNSIQILPSQVQWKNLKLLNLQTNMIKQIPEQFLNLPNLQTLILDDNRFIRLPSSIKFLKSLIQFTMNYSLLQQIPKQIGQLSKLKIFSFFRTYVQYLPIQMEKLKSLQIVQANQSKLSYLGQPSTELTNGEQLHPINLQLKSVVNLNLSGNLLAKFPILLQNLQNLVELKLHTNKIETIDINILSKLLKLKNLDLHGNQIKQLPYEIVNLYQLQTLDISQNNLKKIPGFLSKLKNLTMIDIYNNPPINLKNRIQCLAFVLEKGHKSTLTMIENLEQVSEANFLKIKAYEDAEEKRLKNKQKLQSES